MTTLWSYFFDYDSCITVIHSFDRNITMRKIVCVLVTLLLTTSGAVSAQEYQNLPWLQIDFHQNPDYHQNV